jgi:hypothetical protein
VEWRVYTELRENFGAIFLVVRSDFFGVEGFHFRLDLGMILLRATTNCSCRDPGPSGPFVSPGWGEEVSGCP